MMEPAKSEEQSATENHRHVSDVTNLESITVFLVPDNSSGDDGTTFDTGDLKTFSDIQTQSPSDSDLRKQTTDETVNNSVSEIFTESEVETTETESEIVSLESMGSVISSLRESNLELRQTVEALTAKCNAIEHASKELECQNRTLERDLTLFQNENDQTKKRLAFLTTEYMNFVATFKSNPPNVEGTSGTAEENATVKAENAQLDLAKAEIQKLGSDLIGVSSLVNDLHGKVSWFESEFQRFMRRHSLIVENLCPKEDKSASEMFLVFVNSVLSVKVEDGEIESLHVIGQQSTSSASPDKRPRPILVTFACYAVRSKIYKAWLAFKSSKTQGTGAISAERGQGICIREFLTEQQDCVYQEALQVRDKHLISDCWTFKGKTYIRTLEAEVKEFNKDQWISKQELASSSCTVM